MTDKTPPPAEERQRAAFAALVLMLRELSHGLLAEGRIPESRGLIDGLDALRAKTAGNLRDDEARFLDEVLYELHMAALKARPGTPPERGPGNSGGAAGEGS
jgi:hypothetical protein